MRYLLFIHRPSIRYFGNQIQCVEFQLLANANAAKAWLESQGYVCFIQSDQG